MRTIPARLSRHLHDRQVQPSKLSLAVDGGGSLVLANVDDGGQGQGNAVGHEGASLTRPMAAGPDHLADQDQPFVLPGDAAGAQSQSVGEQSQNQMQTSAGVGSMTPVTVTAASAPISTGTPSPPSSALPSTSGMPTSTPISSTTSSSSSIPTSSASSSSSSSSLLSTPTFSSSIQSLPSAPPAASVDTSTSDHGLSFYIGISFAAIAGAAILLTLFMWWFRIRKRTHKPTWETTWKFGRPSSPAITNANPVDWWQPLGGRSEPKTSLAFKHKDPFRDPQPLPAALMRDRVSSTSAGFVHGPYPTVRPLPPQLCSSEVSIPGVSQNLGSLQISNLVTGDIIPSSGDESSRPSTAMSNVSGSERESRAPSNPRYLSLDNGGLELPWAPLRVPDRGEHKWKARLEERRVSATGGTPPPVSVPVTSQQETWVDSLRANIASGFQFFGAPNGVGGEQGQDQSNTSNTSSTASTLGRRLPTPPALIPSQPPVPCEPTTGTYASHIVTSPHHIEAPFIPPPIPPIPPSYQLPSPHSNTHSYSYKKRSTGRVSRYPSSSVASVGSDMSRTSSMITRVGRLTEKEEAARKALRQRRMRSMGTVKAKPTKVGEGHDV